MTPSTSPPRPLSGNPGYLKGLPLVAGRKAPNSAIMQRISGYDLNVHLNSLCSTSTNNINSDISLLFPFDTNINCQVSLTKGNSYIYIYILA